MTSNPDVRRYLEERQQGAVLKCTAGTVFGVVSAAYLRRSADQDRDALTDWALNVVISRRWRVCGPVRAPTFSKSASRAVETSRQSRRPACLLSCEWRPQSTLFGGLLLASLLGTLYHGSYMLQCSLLSRVQESKNNKT